MAAHRHGVTFTPWAIRDTFAIASLDKPVSGVRIETSQGPVWTDFSGQAVIPSVSAWRDAAVEINTATLPKNMDIGNGLRMLKQGRGAVGKSAFLPSRSTGCCWMSRWGTVSRCRRGRRNGFSGQLFNDFRR